jgi:hypothetical protein
MAGNKIDADPNLNDDEELDLGDTFEPEGDEGEQETPPEDPPAEQEAPPEDPPAEQEAPPEQANGKPQSIPYDRFAEVNSKRKAAEEAAQAEREARIRLEEQLKAMQSQQSQAPTAPAPDPVDTKALIKERNAALLEGDDDRVAEIEAKLEDERVRQAEERAVARMRKEQEEASAKSQATELKAVAAEIVAAYPFLNSASTDADEEAIEDVMALRDRGIAKGMTPAEALRKAVDRFRPSFDARMGTQSEPASQGDPTAASKMRNAKAANAQPPAMKGGMSAGAVPSLPDVNKMSVDDWAKLPDSEREKLLV